MLVANGLFEESTKQHRGRDIANGLGVVSIIDVLVDNAVLPVQEAARRVLKGTKGSILLWPRRLIQVECMGESEPKNRCPPPRSKSKLKLPPLEPTTSIKNPTKMDDKVDEMPTMVKLLFSKMAKHSTFETYDFPAEEHIFGVPKLVTLCWVDFDDLWKGDMLSETLISLYQW